MKKYTIIRVKSEIDIMLIYSYALANNLLYNKNKIDSDFKILMRRETEIILIDGTDFWTVDIALRDGYRQQKMNLDNFQVIDAIDLPLGFYKEV